MENILPRREARENAFLLAFSQTFGDIPLQEALDNHHECDEEHPVDVFGQRLLRAYYEHSAEVDDLISAHLRNWTDGASAPREPDGAPSGSGRDAVRRREKAWRRHQ